MIDQEHLTIRHMFYSVLMLRSLNGTQHQAHFTYAAHIFVEHPSALSSAAFFHNYLHQLMGCL
jgi:hypothetical protein